MTVSNKCIIFDFDGTLADSFSMAHRVFNELSGQYNYSPITDADVQVLRKQTATEFFSTLGIPLFKVPLLAIQARHELRRHIADVPPIKGIAEVLPILQQQGYRMGILTSNSTENVSTFLKSHDLQGFFDFTYCSHDIFGKARRIKILMRKYKLRAESTIYVGDMNADIEAAHKAGIRVVAVSWGYQAREVLEKCNPTWSLDEPCQLAELEM